MVSPVRSAAVIIVTLSLPFVADVRSFIVKLLTFKPATVTLRHPQLSAVILCSIY